MKWHRNPFFHTAVLPPSVAPSAMASARPSADLDSATAAAVRSAAPRGSSARPSTDVQRQPPPPQIQTQPPNEPASPTSPIPSPLSPTTQPRVSFQEPHSSLQAPQQEAQPHTSLNLHQQQQRASFHLPRRHSSQHSQSTPHGILAEAANRVVAHGDAKVHRSKKAPKLTICEPSDHLTPYQAFYIFGIDGLGAFLLSGGINFAIGYAMYKTIDTDKHPIRLFQFPNTLAGDATVTIFIQCILTWFIELVLVNRDLRSGHIQPIGFIKEPSNALLRWFLLLDRRPSKSAAASSGSDEEANGGNGNGKGNAELSAPHDEHCRCEKHVEQYEPGSWKHWAVFLVSQLIRAVIVGVLMFMLMWGPSIGIMTALGDKRAGDWWFDGTSWAPPLFKLIYGGVLAALTTPPFAAFWLVRCGWALQANERHLEAAVASA